MTDNIRQAPNGDYIVDFSGSKRSANMIAPRADAIYGNIDLASGYPDHLIWVTKDKRRIAIPNLSDDHLNNIICFIRKQTIPYKKKIATKITINGLTTMLSMSNAEAFTALTDEEDKVFTLAVSQGVSTILNMPDEDFLLKFFPIYNNLIQEATKRNLTIRAPIKKG
jgi:hypothetical protein